MTITIGAYTTSEDEDRAIVIAAERLMPKQIDRMNKKPGQSIEETVHVQDKKIEVGPNYAFAFAGAFYDETLNAFFPYLRGEKPIDLFLKETGFKNTFAKHPAFQFQRILQSAISKNQEISDFLSSDYKPQDELERLLLGLKNKNFKSKSEIEKVLSASIDSMQLASDYKSPVHNAVNALYFHEFALLNAYLSGKDIYDEDERGIQLILGTNFTSPELFFVNGHGILVNARKDADDDPIIYKGSGEDHVKRFIDGEKFRSHDFLKNTDLHNLSLKEAKYLALASINYAAMPGPGEHGDPNSGFEADLVVITKKGITQYIDHVNSKIRDYRVKLFEEVALSDDK